MLNKKGYKLINIDWPDFGHSVNPPPKATSEELLDRIHRAYNEMKERNLSHLLVYGDREHFANITYFTGFDPRFEETLLIISDRDPLLLVGNECYGYIQISPPFVEKKLRVERFQPFSLLDQPRNESRPLKEIFHDEGINASSQIGCVGYKYFSELEHPHSIHAIDIPAYIVDTLREITTKENILNTTDILMHPDHGLRTTCSASEIAYFEFTGTWASEAAKDILLNLQENMIDYELMLKMRYIGIPLSCHTTMVSGETYKQGMASPSGAKIKRGDPMAFNISYWGSNVCRAGWVVSDKDELPEKAQDYIETFAGPYYEVMSEWLELLTIGRPCSELYDLVRSKLPKETFNIALNPGHLIHLDEWVSSPIYKDSDIKIRSGMVLQHDAIPSSEKYFSTRTEDGYAIADQELREEIKKLYPEGYERCIRRRDFMINTLGINVPKEVLPLSNIPAIVSPFLLKPNMIFSLKG